MLRNSLYLKLFVGFWLISSGILASWLLVASYLDSQPRQVVEINKPGPPPRFVLRLIYQLQNLPESELPTLLSAQQSKRMDIYLIDLQGRDMLGRTVPDIVQLAAQQITPQQRSTVLKADGRPPVAGYAIYRQEQGLLRVVLQFKAQRHSVLRALGDKLWLRALLAVLMSGLLCYLLSRLMTRRLEQLKHTAGELAAGHLDSRIAVRDSGGDETDDLARSFNTMAEQLQRRINAQKRLLSDVSHELRSPLARLKIALALAQQAPSQRPLQLQRIEREADRLEELIEQLLSTQAANQVMDEHIDLVTLLQSLCADVDFEAQSKERGVSFSTDLAQALVTTRGDLLRKSFENILRNAVQHTAVNSRVQVQLKTLADHYEVSIQDAGAGIPESELGRIFDAFYRVDDTRSRTSGGYGLGLSIAQRAINQHSGSIRAENTAAGLLVVVLLPRYRES